MSLQIGQQLGTHEITALLGKGGMGEVYRARDLKLKRDVAIKILAEEFAIDADRVNRFQREAHLLASLNHPNIAQIYGFEESNQTNCIIMELVEGPTLAERLRLGPIPIQDALRISKEIAEALAADELLDLVMDDSFLRVEPQGRVRIVENRHGRHRLAPSWALHDAVSSR